MLVCFGFGIALSGGFHLAWEGKHLKIPNGISLVRDSVLALLVLQLATKFLRRNRREFLALIRPAARAAAPFAGGFLLGFAPVWAGRIFELYEKGYGVGTALLPASRWPAQSSALVESLFALLFSSSGVFALSLLGIVVLLELGSMIQRRSWWGKREANYALAVAALNLAYVFLSHRSEGAPLRYLYPTLIAFWLLVAFLVGGVIRSSWRAGLMMAVLLFSASMSVTHVQELLTRAQRQSSRATNLQSVIRKMERRGLQYCWGDYWTSYLLTYLTEEQIILSPHPDAHDSQVRIPRYTREVAATQPDCYIYRESDSVTATVYFSETNPWRRP
jgi:hypothetical protein